MNMTEMIRSRRSIRTFDGKPLREEDAAGILAFASKVENPYQLPIEWRLLDKKKDNLSVCNTENASLSISADNEDENDVFTITATADGYGEIKPEGAIPVWKGDAMVYSIEPDAGYRIKDVQVDDESVGAVDEYTFTDVNENHRI